MNARTRLAANLALMLLATACALLPACAWDGHFTLLGYSTRPNYDPNIRTVRVPIFQNPTFWRGLEFDVTRAVVREIEQKTPFKVVAEGSPADTELLGTVVGFEKWLANRNPLNEVREAETVLTVEVVWRDLRSGEILSSPRREPCPPDVPPPPPVPVRLQSFAKFIPELAESLTTAQKMNVDRMAVQIVSLMEKPW